MDEISFNNFFPLFEIEEWNKKEINLDEDFDNEKNELIQSFFLNNIHILHKIFFFEYSIKKPLKQSIHSNI